MTKKEKELELKRLDRENKKKIIEEYVAANPTLDSKYCPNVVIPTKLNSAKHGGEYTRFYFPLTGQIFFSDKLKIANVPGVLWREGMNKLPISEEEKSRLFIAKPSATTWYPDFSFVYIKHVPEHRMLETSTMSLNCRKPERGNNFDKREFKENKATDNYYGSHRMFLFADDPMPYDEYGNPIKPEKLGRYYHTTVISTLRWYNNLHYNIAYDYKSTCSYAKQALYDFIGSCDNAVTKEEFKGIPIDNMNFYNFEKLYRTFGKKPAVEKTTPSVPTPRAELVKKIQDVLPAVGTYTDKCPIIINKTKDGSTSWGGYWLPSEDLKSDYIKVIKLNDDIFCIRFLREKGTTNLTKIHKSMKIGEKKTLQNTLYESRIVYCDCKNKIMATDSSWYKSNLKTDKMSNLSIYDLEKTIIADEEWKTLVSIPEFNSALSEIEVEAQTPKDKERNAKLIRTLLRMYDNFILPDDLAKYKNLYKLVHSNHHYLSAKRSFSINLGLDKASDSKFLTKSAKMSEEQIKHIDNFLAGKAKDKMTNALIVLRKLYGADLTVISDKDFKTYFDRLTAMETNFGGNCGSTIPNVLIDYLLNNEALFTPSAALYRWHNKAFTPLQLEEAKKNLETNNFSYKRYTHDNH